MRSVKYLVSVIAICLAAVSCSDKQNLEHLIFKENMAFKPESDKPYSGKVFKLYQSGKIRFEGFYKDGLKDGEFTRYDENKKIIEIDNFKQGEKDGEFIQYDRDGKIKLSSEYKKGLRNGVSLEYENGVTIFEGEYENGSPTNSHTYWYNDGKKVRTKFNHLNGAIVIESAKSYYKSGKIQTEFKRLEKNTYKQIEYLESGKLSHELTFFNPQYEEGTGPNGFEWHSWKGEFDLGNAWIHPVGVELFYDKGGKLSKKTQYFSNSDGVVEVTYYSGKKVVYNNVESYTETFDSSGTITSKCLGDQCFSGSELNNILLINGNTASETVKTNVQEQTYICYTNDKNPSLAISICFGKDGKALNVKYLGKDESIPLSFIKETYSEGGASPTTQTFYSEIYLGQKNGTYKLTHSGAWDEVEYTLGKSGKKFNFTINHDLSIINGSYRTSPCF